MFRFFASGVAFSVLTVLASVISVHAACKEFRMVDHGDSVEVTCIGEPLTEAQKKELEKQATQEAKKLQRASQNKKQVETQDIGKIVLESFDIKYIPSNKILRNGASVPGDYSILIDAKNNGRRGDAVFKIKLADSSGFEIESTSFREFFEESQSKTVTKAFRARRVPLLVDSFDWKIEINKVK